MIMSVCKFFLTEGGCRRGAQCHFEHIRLDNQEQSKTSATAIINGFSTEDARKPSTEFSDPVAQVSCRFFKSGTCKYGERCRFRHDETGEEASLHESNFQQARNRGLNQPNQAPLSDTTEPATQVSCRFFNLGGCRSGDSCSFRHDVKDKEEISCQAIETLATVPLADNSGPLAQVKCVYYIRGTCKNGDQCRFQHDVKNTGDKSLDLTPDQVRIRSTKL